jgi:hypothetical protein
LLRFLILIDHLLQEGFSIQWDTGVTNFINHPRAWCPEEAGDSTLARGLAGPQVLLHDVTWIFAIFVVPNSYKHSQRLSHISSLFEGYLGRDELRLWCGTIAAGDKRGE